MSENDALKRTEELKDKLDSEYRKKIRETEFNRRRADEFAQKAVSSEQEALRIKDDLDSLGRELERLQSIVAQQDEVLKYVSEMEEAYGLAPKEELKVEPTLSSAPVEELSLDDPKEEVKEEVKSDSISEFVPAGDLVKEDIDKAKEEQASEEEKRQEVEAEFKRIGMEFPKDEEKVVKDDQGIEMHIIENPGSKYVSKGFLIVDAPEEVKADSENYAKKSKATIPAKEKISNLWNNFVKQVVEMTHEETKEVKGVEDANTGLRDILPMTEMQPIDIKTITK